MRTPESDGLARGLLRSLRKDYVEEEHRRDEMGRWASVQSTVADLVRAASFVSGLRREIEGIADEESEDVRRQAADNRISKPTDYPALIRRQEERRRRGYEAVVEAVGRLEGVRPANVADAVAVERLREYAATEAAATAARRSSEIAWDEEFRSALVAVEDVLRRSAGFGFPSPPAG